MFLKSFKLFPPRLPVVLWGRASFYERSTPVGSWVVAPPSEQGNLVHLRYEAQRYEGSEVGVPYMN